MGHPSTSFVSTGSLLRGFVCVAASLVFVALGCSKKIDEPTGDFKPAEAAPLPPGPDKLQIVDETVGTGSEAKKGDKVKVHYTGRLLNKQVFDSSVGKDPFEVEIGKGMVIKGWDEGLPGMKVGGKRKLTIPWQQGYGENGSPPKIPGKAALEFDIELLEIVNADGAKDGGAKEGGAKDAPKDAGAKKK